MSNIGDDVKRDNSIDLYNVCFSRSISYIYYYSQNHKHKSRGRILLNVIYSYYESWNLCFAWMFNEVYLYRYTREMTHYEHKKKVKRFMMENRQMNVYWYRNLIPGHEEWIPTEVVFTGDWIILQLRNRTFNNLALKDQQYSTWTNEQTHTQ